MAKKKVVYACKCGHKIRENDKVGYDKFAELRGVKRYTPGNALCPKCNKPIPFDVA